MAKDDPFAGMRLSEQAQGGKLDQRLFTQQTTPVVQPKPLKPEPPQTSAPRAQTQLTSSTLAQRVAQLKPASIANSHFDLGELPLYKASYVFTIEELEALEDLKTQLHRELGAKVTKNDLIRCALHHLVEDYRANGDKSYTSRKLANRSRADK